MAMLIAFGEEKDTPRRPLKLIQASVIIASITTNVSEIGPYKRMETNNSIGPIRLKDMALRWDEWLLISSIVNSDGTVLCDSLFRHPEKICGDFLHSKSTMERIMKRRALDLTINLLRVGIRIEFVDGLTSVRHIANISPPLFDRYYRKIYGNQ
jgi:hypothetical protein